jgi:hypothetical protein
MQDGASPAFPGRLSDLHIGGSISRLDAGVHWGTCGFKTTMRVRGGRTVPCIVTAYHVAAYDLHARGEHAYDFDPERSDLLDMYMPAKILEERGRPIGFLYRGRFNDVLDTAFIQLTNRELPGEDLQDTGVRISGALNVFGDLSYRNREVKIYGAMSGEKTSTIMSVNAQTPYISIEDGREKKRNKQKLIALAKKTAGGDSGSAVLLDDKIIGMVICADPGPDGEFTYIIPIGTIILAGNLNLSFT